MMTRAKDELALRCAEVRRQEYSTSDRGEESVQVGVRGRGQCRERTSSSR